MCIASTVPQAGQAGAVPSRPGSIKSVIGFGTPPPPLPPPASATEVAPAGQIANRRQLDLEHQRRPLNPLSQPNAPRLGL